MKNRLSVMALALVFVAGCGGRILESYEGHDAVSIEFNSSSPHRVSYLLFSDDYDCYGVKYASFMESKKAVPASVRHKKYISFEYLYNAQGGSEVVQCGGVHTFEVKGSSYKVTTNIEDKSCSALVEVRGADGGWKTVEGFSREKTVPFSDREGPHCKSGEEFKGSSYFEDPRGL